MNFSDEIKQDTEVVISFYKFVAIKDLNALRAKMILSCKKKSLLGTILITPEGVNGSLSGAADRIDVVLAELCHELAVSEVNTILNKVNSKAFSKLKVKIKDETISLGFKGLEVEKLKGEYIKPNDWDSFTSKKDVIMIDTRNDYEVDMGTFKNSINPNTKNFKEFPAWAEQNKSLLKGKKIAMFCTGGIRCEKSTSFMRQMGFEEVYHLQGGILKYLEVTGNKSKSWQGNCFVFDDRRGVDDKLEPIELQEC